MCSCNSGHTVAVPWFLFQMHSSSAKKSKHIAHDAFMPLLESFAFCCRTAVSVADVQQESEITALDSVISVDNETLIDLINATISANYTSQLEALDSSYGSNSTDVSFLLRHCLLRCLSSKVLGNP